MNHNVRNIRIDDFDYPLPDSRIASHPLALRDRCKLLVRTHDGTLSQHIFAELPQLLPDGAMLIYNNTRVINARLRFHKGENRDGAPIEIFCLEPVEPVDYTMSFSATAACSWLCFVGNSKRWKDGALSMPVVVDGKEIILYATREERRGNASVVRFDWDADSGISFSQIIAAAGEIPIPPYLNRSTESTDSTDYQTVYNRIEGSVAAPTAGLHFTPEVLEAVDRRGMSRRELTLHVGAGTFQPVKSDNIGDHDMHSEFISVSRSLIEELSTGNAPVIAVGTTSVRTLESLYHIGCLIYQKKWTGELPQWYAYSASHPRLSRQQAFEAILALLDAERADRLIGQTRIIIAPGYTWHVVDGIVTNFHQPRSTLLLLVSAFLDENTPSWRQAYDYALDNDFRFLSYGDAMLLL